MPRARRLIVLFAAICGITCAQSSGTGVISGTVIDSRSGDPVRRATVTVTWQGTPRSWATTRTDGSGKFVFEGLPAGKYDLRATKQGLGTATYGANSIRELGDLITLSVGEARRDLKLRFIHSASISGRVIDREGDPVQNVDVSLLRASRNLGERVLVNYRGSNSNDRGEYKISSIDPGDYYVLCKPNVQRFGVGITPEILVQQYFGGGRDPKDAMLLSVRGGEVLNGIDFHLMTEHAAKITGRVVGVPQLELPEIPTAQPNGRVVANGLIRVTRPGQGQQIMLELSPADTNQPSFTQNRGIAGPDYQFELPDLAPGRYRLQASVRAKEKMYYASQIVDAGPGTTDVILTMAAGVDIKGHLTSEGPRARSADNFTVALAPPPNSGRSREQHSAHVGKEGNFTIENVPPGEWMLNINPGAGSPNLGSSIQGAPNVAAANQGTAMFDKSVRLGDKDYLFKRLEIPAGLDAPLNIVISSNTSIVEGEVDAGDADSKRAAIILGPVGALHNLTRFYYGVLADDTGKFKINGVAPGRYKIFALEKIAVASYRNPESVELLDALGEEIEIPEGDKVQAHPKLIPQEKAREILKP
jgi:Carboxypeptidase regulatory-like domain